MTDAAAGTTPRAARPIVSYDLAMTSRSAVSYRPCRLASITVAQAWRTSSSKLLPAISTVAMEAWARAPT